MKWTIANTTPMATFPVRKPTLQIDWILYRPADRWKVIEVNVIEVKVLEEVTASDHHAIFAVFGQATQDD